MHRREFVAVLSVCALAGCSGPRSIVDGTEQWLIPVGDYESLSFDVRSPATIEYAVEVREGPPVDVLLLREARFEEFEAGALPENTPALRDVEDDTANGNIMPGTWHLVVDNAGSGGNAPTDPVTVTLSYDVTRYIPYGSGRHDDSGPSPG